MRFHAVIFGLCSDDGEITRHRADIFGDRHLVIIEHDYELSCVLPALFKAS